MMTRIAVPTATSITIANMVGTGVFTTLGFQVMDIQLGFSLILVWILGGIYALCGALSYSELAAALPRSGGELHFLSRCYHPAVGFAAGWISATVGFAAPIALAAMAFARYFNRIIPSSDVIFVSCLIVLFVTAVHLRDLRLGSYFQNLFTLFKLILIVGFIGCAAAFGKSTGLSFSPSSADSQIITSPSFAVALLFVTFSYSGWNAAAYIIDDIRDPAYVVPRSLILGTLLVTILYVALNWAFLATTPMASMSGQIEIGHIAADAVFGSSGGRIMSSMLCIALISTISAMTWAGPRVTQVIGQDVPAFATIAKTNRFGVPTRAILFQTAIVLVLLVTSTFDRILVFIQFTLVLSSALAVLGVIVLRWRQPDLHRPYRAWGYPFTPIIFLALSLWILVYTMIERPWESLAGLAISSLGVILYRFSKPPNQTATAESTS